MAKLADIAREAGLSIPAVSQILNDHPGYRPETRQRVQEIAEQLGYRPNSLAKALVSGKTNTLGFMTSGVGVPIHALMIEGVMAAARERGFMLYVTGYRDNTNAQRLIEEMVTHCVAGVLLYQVMPVLQSPQTLLVRNRIPHLFLDCVPPDAAGVVMNRAAGFDQAIAHLAELGHRRVCFLTTGHDVEYPERRIDPYRRACERFGVGMTLMALSRSQWREEVREQVRQILVSETREPVTAWLCGDDELAIATIAAIQAAGRRVPEDFSVVGFNDLPIGRVTWPSLTTIHQPTDTLPEVALSLLEGLIHGAWAGPRREVIDCHLVVRDSTGPAPAGR